MKKVKKFNLHGIFLTITLIFVLILILAGIYFLTYPILKNTQLYSNINKTYQDNVWVTFNSDRAKFSFKHPISWPVSKVDFKIRDGAYKYLADDGVIEYIDFEEEFSGQAGGPSLGFIIVEETNYKNLKDYVDELSKEKTSEMLIKGTTQKVTIRPPKIEYLKIGGVDAISVTNANNLATFTKNTVDYQLIRDGWIYRFVTTSSSRFLENKEKNSQTFQKIISSVKFFN